MDPHVFVPPASVSESTLESALLLAWSDDISLSAKISFDRYGQSMFDYGATKSTSSELEYIQHRTLNRNVENETFPHLQIVPSMHQ